MKKVVRLNEKDIEKLVKKIMKEEKSINETGYKGGMTFGPFVDLVDSVTDRYRIYREEYREALDQFNKQWPLKPSVVRNLEAGTDSKHPSLG